MLPSLAHAISGAGETDQGYIAVAESAMIQALGFNLPPGRLGSIVTLSCPESGSRLGEHLIGLFHKDSWVYDRLKT